MENVNNSSEPLPPVFEYEPTTKEQDREAALIAMCRRAIYHAANAGFITHEHAEQIDLNYFKKNDTSEPS